MKPAKKANAEPVIFPLIDYLNEPIVVLKKDGSIAEANQAFLKLAGTEKKNLIGKSNRDIIPLQLLSDVITKCMAEKTEKSGQITLGSYIFNATLTPVTVKDQMDFISVVLRDVSAFIRLEKALLKRNKELGIINTLSSAFISSGNIDSVIGDLLEKVLIVSDFSIGWMVLKERSGFVPKGISGISDDLRNEIENDSFAAMYESVIASTDPLYVLESEDIDTFGSLKKEGIVFFSCIPLRIGSETMGVLVLASRVAIKFDFDLAALFSLIGNTVSLILEKIRLFQETQHLALTDGLTGLYNLRYFYDMLGKEIARTKRYNTSFSLVLFDIDDFKHFNDTYGHQAGDEILSSVASMLKSSLRESDIAVRYGGEEFILMLPNTPKHEAFSLGNRIREMVYNHSYDINGQTVKISVSGGVATFPEDAPDAKSLLYAADMAMYDAKAMGKKQVCLYGRKSEASI